MLPAPGISRSMTNFGIANPRVRIITSPAEARPAGCSDSPGWSLMSRSEVPLHVAQQRLEAIIHVHLDMAVEQRQSRLVGGKVYAGAPIGGQHDRVLDHARGGFAINLGDLELVPMQVHRMRIVGAVTKSQPVARALFEQKLL